MTSSSYSTNGEKAILYSIADIVGTPGAGEAASEGDLYLDIRTAAGWQLSPLNPPSAKFAGQVPVAAEADSGETLWKQHTVEQGAHRVDLYARSAAGSSFRLIGPLALPREGVEEPSDYMDLSGKRFDRPVAATSNYEHVVLWAVASEDYWTFDGTTSNNGSLYEYSGTENKEPILVAVNGAKGSRELIGTCGAHLGSPAGGSTYNAISSDGETIFFTVFPGCGTPASSEIYARLHGSLTSGAEAKTMNVSASECTVACGEEVGEEASGKNFEGASEDGQHVFFTSTQKLTNEAVDGVASGNSVEGEGCAVTTPGLGGCNLYEYSFVPHENKHLRLVAGGEVLGVAGIAEDGSHVYFVSRKLVGEEEQHDLYVYDAQSKTTAFIVKLGGDGSDWEREFGARSTEVGGRDGRFLLFLSSTPGVTPDDNSNQEQLFEYKAKSGSEPAELVRLTKGEDGYNEDGNGVTAGVPPSTIESIDEPLGNGNDFKSTTNRLNLSVDGTTAFFLTVGQLSPRATSAALGCRNLYEFHTAGALREGKVHLISDGRDTQLLKGNFCGPQFQGMDETGANALFTTADPLISSDVDGVQRDLYDARVGGGFLPAPAGETGSCTTVCEGPATSPPGVPLLGSVGGPGEAPIAPPLTSKKKVNAKRKGGSGNSAKLASALRACRGKPKARRAACERSARRRYGSKVKAKKSLRKG